jgi:2'-5' RNA ligase
MVVRPNTWRLFVAIELPRALKRELIDLAGSLRPREHERVRWIGQDAMHLTLKFLGDTPTEKVGDIKDALQQAASSTGKFSIKVGRTGCFPSFRDPRICWIGLSGALRQLEQLQGRVEGGLVSLGFDGEDRTFTPHVTVGRVRPGIRGRLAKDIGVSWRYAPLHATGTTIPISAIALYRSYLGEKNGARYEQLANLELG